MVVILLALGLSAGLSYADLRYTRGSGGSLVLSGAPCPVLLDQEKKLCEWKKALDPESKSTPSGQCSGSRITVQSCLPEVARLTYDIHLARSGPNCWGTAMSFGKLYDRPRFMWPEEMLYWSNSPLCQKVPSGEALKPGDIITAYGPEKLEENERKNDDAGTRFWDLLFPGRKTEAKFDPRTGNKYTGYQLIMHSATYISPELIFDKNSPAREDHFQFHALSDMYARPTDKACQENQQIEPYLRENQAPPKDVKHQACSYFTQAYRCQSLSSLIPKESLAPEDQDVLSHVKRLQGLQDSLWPLLTGGGYQLERCEIDLMRSLIDLALNEAGEGLKDPKKSKNREMLLVQEYFAAAGLRQTLEFAGSK